MNSRIFKDPGILLFTLLLALFMPAAVSLAEDCPKRVVLGTATKGGGFQLFGEHLAAVMNGWDESLRVEAIATKGSKENLSLLEGGKIDIGLVEGNAARQALDGIGREPSNLKVLYVMYPNPGMFAVRADSPYEDIAALREQPIAFGTKASGLRILANDVLDGLGLRPDTDFQQVILNKASEGPELVLAHKVEALWGAGIGWPGFVKVANGVKGARFIAPDVVQIKRILAKHPHLKRMSVPANTYKGQNQRIDSVGLWSLILVRPDLPEERVYRLARSIHKGEADLAQRLAQGCYTTANHTVAEVPYEHLHTGARRYLQDAGLIK